MQKVLTSGQMREVDRLTTEKYRIPSIILMENAGHALARVIAKKLGGSVVGKSILVLCGKGNNGGDGTALARILWTQGANVNVCLMFPDIEFKGDARHNLELIQNLHAGQTPFREPTICITETGGHRDFLDNPDKNFGPDAVVDAIFGTGLTRPLNEEHSIFARSFAGLTDTANRPVCIAVDLPTGLDADKSAPIGEYFRADVTVTFTSPKPANILPPVCRSNGELFVEQIGSPLELVDAQPSDLYLLERLDAVNWLRKTGFSDDSYKNKRGHALLIAGSESYSGAAVLCGNAAMRSGVGLVTIAAPKSSKDSIASRALPEVIVRGVAETDNGSIAAEAFAEISDLLEKSDSIAIGSGLSLDESTKRFVNKIASERRQAMIIDADALTLLSPFSNPHEDRADWEFPLILTPHEGEFRRLIGGTDKEIIKDRVAAVRDFATRHQVILVLKGERALIGGPDGKVIVNPTGNSGLGKAGNGDTLTGIIAGFVAQALRMKVDIFETVAAAVYISGMAGDIAEKKYGRHVMTASDVRECLSDAFADLLHEPER